MCYTINKDEWSKHVSRTREIARSTCLISVLCFEVSEYVTGWADVFDPRGQPTTIVFYPGGAYDDDVKITRTNDMSWRVVRHHSGIAPTELLDLFGPSDSALVWWETDEGRSRVPPDCGIRRAWTIFRVRAFHGGCYDTCVYVPIKITVLDESDARREDRLVQQEYERRMRHSLVDRESEDAMLSTVVRAHVAALILFLGQFVALAVLAKDTHLYVSLHRVTSVWQSNTVDVEQAGSTDIGSAPMAFVLLAMFTHAASAGFWSSDTGCVDSVPYRDRVKQGRGWYCWAEFTFSASLMNMSIAVLSGVTTHAEAGSVFVLTAVTMWFGAASEYLISKGDVKPAKLLFAAGFVAFSSAWAIIAIAFSKSAPSAPDFVTVIFVVLLAAELVFAINAAVFLRRVETRPSAFVSHAIDYELGKIGASVCSKTLLAWLLYGGIFARV